MTISTSTDYTETRASIIKNALIEIRVISSEEDVESADGELLNGKLNRMIKAWQAHGINLWKKATGAIFLEKDRNTYDIYSGSSQHVTETYYKSTLSADAASSDTKITVTDATNFTIGNYLGINLDDGSSFWTTITNIISNDLYFNPDTLPSAASTGKAVYNYSTKLEKPFDILAINRMSLSDLEIPVSYVSYDEFFKQPNKTTNAVPTIYNYDRQLDFARIRVWPTPANTDEILNISFTKIIADFDNNANNPEFPQEWYEALVLNLAVNCASAFGKNIGQSYQNLKIDAQNALNSVSGFDNEQGSIFIQPSYRYRG